MSMEQNRTNFEEKRRHSRIETTNLVDYILFDESRKKVDHGKGRALNLSQSGALLETQKPVNGSYIVLITIDLDGKKVQVKGRVANTRQSDKVDTYLTGVEFIGSKDEQLAAIVSFVKAYHRRKHSGQSKETPDSAE